MVDWTALLKSVIPELCMDRPFVCDGFPDKSCVIVIGENPATQMDKCWWHYWSKDTGFNIKAFKRDYEVKRMERGKRPVSNTRRRLDWLRENGIRCVETNVYRNEKAGGAGAGTPNYDVLNLLVRNMPALCAVIAHGKVAHRLAEEFAEKYTFPKDTKIFRMRHFRMDSREAIEGICQEIKARGTKPR